jgi:hypothetical protein
VLCTSSDAVRFRRCRARPPVPCASAGHQGAVRIRRCRARPPMPCASACAVRVRRCRARPPVRMLHGPGGGGPCLQPPVYCENTLKLLLTPLTSRTKVGQWSSTWPETICSSMQNMKKNMHDTQDICRICKEICRICKKICVICNEFMHILHILHIAICTICRI